MSSSTKNSSRGRSSVSSTARTGRKRKHASTSSSSEGDFRQIEGSGSASTNSTPASALGRTPRMQVQRLGSSEREVKKFNRFVDNMSGRLASGLASFVDHSQREEPEHVLVLTDTTGRVKGYAACNDNKRAMHVSALYVKKQARGGGRKLMEGVAKLARDEGKQKISLESVPTAVDFYTKLGFTKARTRWRRYLTPMIKTV